MTLASRLSLFFLAALAVVLIGFSATLYGLARVHLFRQVDAQSTAIVDAMTAAVDVEPDGLEWEASERLFKPEQAADGAIVWAVFDENGQQIDGLPQGENLLSGATGESGARDLAWHGETWRIHWRTLRSPGNPPGSNHHDPEPEKKRHRVLVMAVGVPLGPIFGTLRTLALALAGVSAIVWACAAVFGRLLCWRALMPLTNMAKTARAISAADLGQRLPQAYTKDELEDLGRAFNDLLTRLQDSFERQRRFTGEASHQLRTPLTAMMGQVEVALRHERSVEEYRRVLTSVQSQSERLHQIVEMLLFLARADADAKLPELEEVELSTWLVDHVKSWKEHPRYSDIQLKLANGPVWVRVHPWLLAQALDNLLDNACKYSPRDSAIVVGTGIDGADGSLWAEDHGFGIAPSELPHLFVPFYRSEDARQRGIGGVGLGLAVTARIISALGGHIDLTSQPGQGSRFMIRLPVVRLPNQASQS